MEEAAPPHDEGQAPYGVSDEKEILSQAEARRVEATSVVDAKLEENHANEPIDDVAEKEQEERNAENEKEAAKTSIEKERREGREGEKEEIKEKEKEKEKDVGRSGASKPSPTAGQPRRRGGIQNYKFYMNEIVSQPSGNYIDQVHLLWFYNYEKLEEHHGYIQWLFPVFESEGMNRNSAALGKDEANMIRTTFECACRVLKSYKLMLNFYGLRLVDEATGELERTEEWQDRFLNLNICTHNNLRISRIFMSLGEMGFGRYKKPFIEHLTREIIEKGQLHNCKASLQRYWHPLVYEEDTPTYKLKTKEDPEDREESVFFIHMKNQTNAYLEWKTKEKELEKKMAELKKKAQADREEKRKRGGWKVKQEPRQYGGGGGSGGGKNNNNNSNNRMQKNRGRQQGGGRGNANKGKRGGK